MQHVSVYEFDDLDLGQGLIVRGTAEIEWEYREPELDGFFKGGEFLYEIGELTIITKHGNSLALKDHDRLRRDVEYALILTRDIPIQDMLERELTDAKARADDDKQFNADLRRDAALEHEGKTHELDNCEI